MPSFLIILLRLLLRLSFHPVPIPLDWRHGPWNVCSNSSGIVSRSALISIALICSSGLSLGSRALEEVIQLAFRYGLLIEVSSIHRTCLRPPPRGIRQRLIVPLKAFVERLGSPWSPSHLEFLSVFIGHVFQPFLKHYVIVVLRNVVAEVVMLPKES